MKIKVFAVQLDMSMALRNGLKLIVVLQMLSCFAYAQTSSRTGRAPMHSLSMGGIFFDTALTYAQTEGVATPSTGNTWQSNTTLADFKLGYLTENQIYVGGIYSSRNDSQLGGTNATGTSAGFGLGKFGAQGFNVRAFYKFNENFGSYQSGSGIQIDAGWVVNLAASFYLGIDLSYREITYKSNPSIAGFQSWNRKEIYPFVTLGFLVF